MDKTMQLANLYLSQAKIDLKTAKLEKDKAKTIVMAIQAAINALNAMLHANGSLQNPSFSLNEMLKMASKYEPNLLNFDIETSKIDELQNLPLLGGLEIDLKDYLIVIEKIVTIATDYLSNK